MAHVSIPRGIVAPVLLWALVGCAHVAKSADGGGGYETITEEEIAKVEAVNAYDIILKTHANFLSYRGRTSFYNTSSPDPNVYVDDVAYGPTSILKTIPAAQVATIRLYRAWEATYKFGTGNMGGVIEVYTKH